MPDEAAKGDTVKIEYTGRLKDGTVFDTTDTHGPLEFTIGEGRILAGVERVVEGMKLDEEKTVSIDQAQAYGPSNPDLVMDVEKSRLPNIDPQPGQTLKLKSAEGEEIVTEVIEVTETHVKLDANHPLAGKDLDFTLKLVEISKPGG